MVFDNLIVYISHAREGGLMARVKMYDQVTGYYGRDMLRSNPCATPEEAMFEATRQLCGKTKTITFLFAKDIAQTKQEFSYCKN